MPCNLNTYLYNYNLFDNKQTIHLRSQDNLDINTFTANTSI
jgi:hypothetical protein